jgi:hypothetical protein
VTLTPTTSAFALWVPIAVKGANGDDSGIQVQNTAGSAATVSIEYYDQAGNLVFTNGPQTVQASSSITFYQPAELGLPLGFDGSAVVRSSQAVAAIVNRVNYTSTLASAGSLTVPATPGNTYTIPLVYGGMNNYFTTISVQNAGTTPATYTVALQANAGSSGTVTPVTVTIPPNAVRRFRVGVDVAVPAGFIGTANITGGSMVAVGETRNTSTSIWLAAGGVAGGATTQNAPLQFKNYDVNQWNTAAQVANTTSSTVTVNASVRSRDDNTTYSLPTVTLGPNQGFLYDLLSIGGVPDNFVGSGVFTATGPIALTVQEVSTPKQTGMGYNGFSTGTTRVSVPLVFKNANQGWDTGVQVQNLGTVPTSISISYFNEVSGLLASESEVAQPGDSVTFYQPANATLPAGLVGSATVTSDGQPIVAIINEVNYLRGGDASMSYEGINY